MDMRRGGRSHTRLYSKHVNQTHDAKHVNKNVNSEAAVQTLNLIIRQNKKTRRQQPQRALTQSPPFEGGLGGKDAARSKPKNFNTAPNQNRDANHRNASLRKAPL